MSLGWIVSIHPQLEKKSLSGPKRDADRRISQSVSRQHLAQEGCCWKSTARVGSICWTHQVPVTSSVCEAHSQQTDAWAFKRPFRL